MHMANKASVPGSIRRMVFKEENYTCKACGIQGYEKRFPRGGYGYYTAVDRVSLSIDHITPKSKGGSNDRTNLRVLCTPCITKKGVKSA
jgi:5-methylcytosine-specific restriction endonuclease McrA